MLVKKEVFGPGEYTYIDEASGLPKKWTVTVDTIKHLHDQGNKMVALGLPIPVPYEHDFQAHPMTPKEKMLNNAGEVRQYQIEDVVDPVTHKTRKDVLFSTVDVQDDDAKRKIGNGSIRWTSPWITSFTDGAGRQWNNVIGHLALTTRPRVTKQAPFQSIAAALSMATENKVDMYAAGPPAGFCVSKAGRLVKRKKDGKVCPQYPMAFSIYTGGAKFAADDDMDALTDDGDPAKTADDDEVGDITGLMDPMKDQNGDVEMEELLCDLLNALGVQMPDNVGEAEFKRALYEAAMGKIKELSAKGQAAGSPTNDAANNTTSPANPTNPILQQEQQPMYMSLEEINKITDPVMKNIALSMYNNEVKLRAEMEADRKKLNALNESKLKEESVKRAQRIAFLTKVAPTAAADLQAMVAQPSFALSMGDGGVVVDPMAATLATIEKVLGDMPRLLTTPSAALSEHAHPVDGTEMTNERADEISERLVPKQRAG